MSLPVELDAAVLLERVAARVPKALRVHVVVIGSIASAWAFRDVSGTHAVATKDIDLVMHPAVDAVITSERLGKALLDQGWQPQYPHGRQPGNADTPDDHLPALRLRPPDEAATWFVELLAEAAPDQRSRRHWRRFKTPLGDFGLPSFRYIRVAIHGAQDTAFGLRVARPARMALAHLLEHAQPDRTPISSLAGNPPRFIKDLGRAIALWWLAREQSPLATEHWLEEWRATTQALFPGRDAKIKAAARAGLDSVGDYLRDAHAIALNSILAPHGTTFEAFRRARAGLGDLIDQA